MNGKLDVDTKFADAANQWVESRTLGNGQGRARYVAPGTLKSYREYIRALNRFFHDLKLGEIHIGHLRQYQLQRSNGELGTPPDTVIDRCAKQRKRSVAEMKADPVQWQWVQTKLLAAQVQVNPNKINQEITTLIAIMKRANAWTAEMEEEFEHLQREENDVPRSLSPEQQDRFLRVAGSRDEWRVVFQYSTLAFRATATNCEMRNLRLGDINAQSGVIHIQARTAKNKFRIRTIPLAPDAHWAIQELLKRAYELGSGQPQHYLFPFRVVRNCFDPTKPMSNSGIKRDWEEIRREAGVPWFRIHDLRHTAITRLAEAGTPIAVIMSMSGHISPRMVRHYTQISEQAQRVAVDAAYQGRIYQVPRRPMASAAVASGYPGRHPQSRGR